MQQNSTTSLLREDVVEDSWPKKAQKGLNDLENTRM